MGVDDFLVGEPAVWPMEGDESKCLNECTPL